MSSCACSWCLRAVSTTCSRNPVSRTPLAAETPCALLHEASNSARFSWSSSMDASAREASASLRASFSISVRVRCMSRISETSLSCVFAAGAEGASAAAINSYIRLSRACTRSSGADVAMPRLQAVMASLAALAAARSCSAFAFCPAASHFVASSVMASRIARSDLTACVRTAASSESDSATSRSTCSRYHAVLYEGVPTGGLPPAAPGASAEVSSASARSSTASRALAKAIPCCATASHWRTHLAASFSTKSSPFRTTQSARAPLPSPLRRVRAPAAPAPSARALRPAHPAPAQHSAHSTASRGRGAATPAQCPAPLQVCLPLQSSFPVSAQVPCTAASLQATALQAPIAQLTQQTKRQRQRRHLRRLGGGTQ